MAARRTKTAWFAGLTMLALLAGLRVWDPVPVTALRLYTFDAYQRLAPRPMSDHPVVIVYIDEESLGSLGQWPWPRTALAELVERLVASGAAAIAFDIVFLEPDGSAIPGADAAFAAAIAGRRVVLGRASLPGRARTGRPGLAEPWRLAVHGGDPMPFVMRVPAIIGSLPRLEDAAGGLGVFTPAPEFDGVARRIPQVIGAGGRLYPTLALELLRVAGGERSYLVVVGDAGVKSVRLGERRVPSDGSGAAWLWFHGHDPGRYVSVMSVLDGAAADTVAGRLVLVGSSAVGLVGGETTPLDTMPSVELHAELVEAILSDDLLWRPAFMDRAELIVLIVVGVVTIAVFAVARPRAIPLVLAAETALLGDLSWLAFAQFGLLIDAAFPLLVCLLLAVLFVQLGRIIRV